MDAGVFSDRIIFTAASACLRLHSKLLSCACESESSSKVEKKKIGSNN